MVKPYPALVSALVMAAGLANVTGCRRPPPQPPHVTPPSAEKAVDPAQNLPGIDQDHRRIDPNPPKQEPHS